MLEVAAPTTLGKIIQRLARALLLVLIVAVLALWMKPPEILRVGANYSAKIARLQRDTRWQFGFRKASPLRGAR